MMNRLAGRAALVTGGGNEIGRAIAERFVRDGASVVPADIGLGGTTVGVPMEPPDQALPGATR